MISMLKLLHILIYFSVILKHLALAQVENQFIYNGFNAAENLTLSGSAKVHPNGLLELTNTSVLQIGRALFSLPLKFNNSQSLSFSTNFVFAIDPQEPEYGGHGFVFTMSPKVDFPGAMAQEFYGVFNPSANGSDRNHVVAIEFDTIQTVEFRDINNNHVGIDVNNLTSIVSAPAAYYPDMESQNKSLVLVSRNPIHVWIDYDQVEMLLNVTIAPVEIMKPKRPLLSTRINLSPFFSDSVYVGFSASTGSMGSYHYILGWSFNKSGQAQSLDLSNLPSLPPRRKSGKTLRILIPSLTASFVLIVIIFGAVYIIRRKKYGEVREDWEQEYGPQRFAYKDLYKATKGFKDNELLGFGGFGKVYRGVLPSTSDEQVAVKKISHNSQQGMKEFVAEIVSMGRLRHRNLVQLLGYCRRKGELLLVYDYMPNGSLDKFIFSDDTPNLNWVQRYQILKGIASALLYLHEEWEQVVLHRDVKASNVMLDGDLNGRLGDFGMAKFYDHGSNPQTTCVVGTVGYLAPEVSRTGKATTSSDVFAFGTLMLEVACGRKPVDGERTPEELILVDWVLACWRNGDILETSDPKLEGKYVVEEMELVLKLGTLCSHPIPAARPTMRQVVKYLDGKATLPEMPLEGAGIGLITIRQDCILSFPESSDYSGLSTVSPILSSGR